MQRQPPSTRYFVRIFLAHPHNTPFASLPLSLLISSFSTLLVPPFLLPVYSFLVRILLLHVSPPSLHSMRCIHLYHPHPNILPSGVAVCPTATLRWMPLARGNIARTCFSRVLGDPRFPEKLPSLIVLTRWSGPRASATINMIDTCGPDHMTSYFSGEYNKESLSGMLYFPRYLSFGGVCEVM